MHNGRAQDMTKQYLFQMQPFKMDPATGSPSLNEQNTWLHTLTHFPNVSVVRGQQSWANTDLKLSVNGK